MTEEIFAKVMGNDLPISTKHSIEIADFIRYKNLQKARNILQLTINEELPLPLKRFHKDRGHKKGNIGPGFYPKKAATHIIKLLNSLEANAKNKGMDPDLLFIAEITANRAAGRSHMGRNRGKMKSTNLKIIAKEKKQKIKPKEEKKPEPKKKSEKPKEKKQEKKWLRDK